MSLTADTSKTTNTPMVHSSNNDTFLNGEPVDFQKPLPVSNSVISSIFGLKTTLPDYDSTLTGDYEIPWVPLTPSPITECHGGEITFEDFFDFVEQNPSMQIHKRLCSLLIYP
jgi:hypothetical protein